MKPPVTRVSRLPWTALVSCPHCYRLVSYESGQRKVRCHACGAAVIGETTLTADQSPFSEE
jgi:LSD1 subclass zinc finger protein